jgi:hypothetical protein
MMQSPGEIHAAGMLLHVSSAVIAQLDRATQYAAASRWITAVSGILDRPLSLSSGAHSRDPLAGDDTEN